MNNKQQELNQELNKIVSRIDELEPQRRALNDEYMVIRCVLEDLEDRKDELENEIWGMESEEMLKEDNVKTIEENEAIEMEQLIDEIKNPDFDLKDLESS